MARNTENLDPKARCIPATHFCDVRRCPTDRQGRPFKIGYRICKNFDCITSAHITQSRYIARKIYGTLPRLYRANITVPVAGEQLVKIARPVDRDRTPKECQVDGCGLPHRGLGLCNAHHNQLYRWRAQHGKPARIRQDNSDIDQYVMPPAGNDLKVKDRFCHYPRCDRDYFARGLCKTHHKRWLRWRQQNDLHG